MPWLRENSSPPANGEGPTKPPPRGVKRTAPHREPVVIQRKELADSTIQTILQLPPDADAYISSGYPDQDFGGDALFLGYNLGDYQAERILLQFDVAGHIPVGAIINDAQLRLYLYLSDPPDDSPMGTVLRRLASSWDEYTVTWNDDPEWGGIRASTDVGGAETSYEWDVTGLVTDWFIGKYPNYGMEIIGDERDYQQRERIFHSRETTTDFFPILVVDYTPDTEPPDVTVNPLSAYVTSTFPVSWSGTDTGGSGIAYYDVQYQVDGGSWTDWHLGVVYTSTQFTSGQNGEVYGFRARGVDKAGNVEPYDGVQALTTVDTQPPTSTVSPLPTCSTSTFTVSWSGADSGPSGIDHYDVQYRVDSGNWMDWQSGVTHTSAQFSGGQNGRAYQFRVRAVDEAGNVESYGGSEAQTTVDTAPPTSTVNPLPRITQIDNFVVSWTGQDACAGIHHYDVQDQFNLGSWTAWQNETLTTSATFAAMADGLYGFRVRAVDNLDNVEHFPNEAQARIVVDTVAPFVEPRVWLAVVARNLP